MILQELFVHRPPRAARFAILSLGILILSVFARATAASDEESNPNRATTDAPALTKAAKDLGSPPSKYPLGDISQWLPLVKSFLVQAEIQDERNPEQIAKDLHQLKSQYPDLESPDPLVFTQLLPTVHISVEYDIDQPRLRSLCVCRTAQDRDLNRDLSFWDGKRTLMHYQNFHTHQNDFRLAPKAGRVWSDVFSYLNYLSRQPPIFWWNNSPEARRDFEQHHGTPADFILVDRETYHGVDCHVLMSSVGNQSDRYYIGEKDGRWYGTKEGIIAIPDRAANKRTYQLAVEEFLGKKLGDNPPASVIEEIGTTLRSLPQDRKTTWCRLLYSRLVKNYTPCFEYWFSDFRDLGDGRFFPYRETLLFYEHEGQEKIFVGTTRTITIKEISIDKPLEERLFQEELTEGAMIADDIHQPPLLYKQKAKFTSEEWQAIEKEAKDRDAQETASRKKIEQIIGRPAPPLPNGDWLNSRPLTWNDLRGKIVLLKFWSIGCGPCYGELSALSGPASDDKSSRQGDKNDSAIPIVFIGVHTAGNTREEIEKVVNTLKLRAPICVDSNASGDSGWGDFFGQCAVEAMPTTVAVDEGGRILAHGSFSAVFIKASQRSKNPESK